MSHILNPFMLQMWMQNTWLTLLAVFSWESVEVLAVTVFRGDYVIFVGDDSEIEPITDSLIGDVLQGIIGILLAELVIIAFKVPSWTPSFWSSYRGIWVKHLFFYVVWVISLSSTNLQIEFPGTYSANVGVYFAVISTFVMITISYWTSLTRLERHAVWKGYTQEEYDVVHLGWGLNALCIILGAIVHVWYSYFMTWAWVALAVVCDLCYLLFKGRLWELTYAINCGFKRQRYYEDQVYMDDPAHKPFQSPVQLPSTHHVKHT